MSAHTPGPWRWVPDANGYPTTELVGGNDESLLSIYESHGGGEMPDSDDANLIAAAPDLLAALKELREWSRSEYQNNPRIDARADAAIAKAEGRP